MNPARILLSVSYILFLTVLPSRAVEPGSPFAPERPADGRLTLTFTERSPITANKDMAIRMGWDIAAEEAAKIDYTLADESFEVYVPAAYDGKTPYGLFVFSSPSPSGAPPRQWLKAMDEHKLIWLGPNKVGNDRIVRPRMGLAIDGALNMQKRYAIDPKRIYAAGVSGGGRVASMLGVSYADVFTGGGYYIIGCNFYREEKSAEQGGVFRRSFNVPPAKLFGLAKKTRHVFLTGDTDGNREQTALYYAGFKRDGFEHATYLQVPGMGHRSPDIEWFEKGMAALDPPADVVAAETAKRAAAAPAAATAGPVKVAATQQATEPAAVAARLLTAARLYVDNHQYERAREKLDWIVKTYPGTPAAAEARRIAAGLPKG
jgi:hypothetical protein